MGINFNKFKYKIVFLGLFFLAFDLQARRESNEEELYRKASYNIMPAFQDDEENVLENYSLSKKKRNKSSKSSNPSKQFKNSQSLPLHASNFINESNIKAEIIFIDNKEKPSNESENNTKEDADLYTHEIINHNEAEKIVDELFIPINNKQQINFKSYY